MERVSEMELAEQAEYIMSFSGYLSNETMRKMKDTLAESHTQRSSLNSELNAVKERLGALDAELGSSAWKESSQEYQQVSKRHQSLAMQVNHLNLSLTQAEVFYKLAKDWNETKQHLRVTAVRTLVIAHLQETIFDALPEGRLFPAGVFDGNGMSARHLVVANILKYLERTREALSKGQKSKSVTSLPDTLPKFVLQDRIPKLFENIELK